MQHPLIVSYYTPDTAYETNAMALLEDVRRFNLEARVEPRPARNSWVENCALKAGFIRDMHRQERRPLLWLDADARLRRPLHELNGVTADLAVVRRQGWSFYGGQIYFGAGPRATRLLDAWCDYCERFPLVWDQVSLGYAWWDVSVEERVNSIWLKDSVFERASRRRVGRLRQRWFSRRPILQQQESRRSKPLQAPAPGQEVGNDDVPVWWRQAAAREAPFALSAAQRHELGLS